MIVNWKCPFCGKRFLEHNFMDDSLETLGSIYIDGVNYIVPMEVVENNIKLKKQIETLEQSLHDRNGGFI